MEGQPRARTPSRKKEEETYFHDEDMARAIRDSLKGSTSPGQTAKRARIECAHTSPPMRTEQDNVLLVHGGGAVVASPAAAAAIVPEAGVTYPCTVCNSTETFDGNPIVMCDGKQGRLVIFNILISLSNYKLSTHMVLPSCSTNQTPALPVLVRAHAKRRSCPTTQAVLQRQARVLC